MTPLERINAALAEAAAGPTTMTMVYANDLRLVLDVVEAAKARFDVWTRETYVALDEALKRLQEPT